MSALKTTTAIAAMAAATMQIGVARVNAQDSNTNMWTCWNVTDSEDPVGDRPDHNLAYNWDICRIDTGPLAGGLATGEMSWEHDGANSKELTLRLIVRKPGASALLEGKSGAMTPVITDGKVTGMTGQGRYDYVLATGSWAPLTGKSETWTFKSIGPKDFTVEGKLE